MLYLGQPAFFRTWKMFHVEHHSRSAECPAPEFKNSNSSLPFISRFLFHVEQENELHAMFHVEHQPGSDLFM